MFQGSGFRTFGCRVQGVADTGSTTIIFTTPIANTIPITITIPGTIATTITTSCRSDAPMNPRTLNPKPQRTGLDLFGTSVSTGAVHGLT